MNTRVITIQVNRTPHPPAPSWSQHVLTLKTSYNPNFYCTPFLFSLYFWPKHASPNTIISCCHFVLYINWISHTVYLTWYLASFLVILLCHFAEASVCSLLFLLVLIHEVLFTYSPGYLYWCDDQYFFFFFFKNKTRNFGVLSSFLWVMCEACVNYWQSTDHCNPMSRFETFCTMMIQSWIQEVASSSTSWLLGSGILEPASTGSEELIVPITSQPCVQSYW